MTSSCGVLLDYWQHRGNRDINIKKVSPGNKSRNSNPIKLNHFRAKLKIVNNTSNNIHMMTSGSKWKPRMETFSALLALFAGNSPVTGGFPPQRPVTRSFDVFFDLRLNKRLSKQSRRRWFETQLRSLWRHHCNVLTFLDWLLTDWCLSCHFLRLGHKNVTNFVCYYILMAGKGILQLYL